MDDDAKQQIVDALLRDLMLDLFDGVIARALEAGELAREKRFTGRRARQCEGFNRFLLLEQMFEEVCAKHGGVALAGEVIPGSDLKFFQPFRRFGGDGRGVLLALASMPSPKELPKQNRSRTAGVSLNVRWTPELDFDGTGGAAQPDDIFVLLLFARDPERAGQIEEVAVGVIDGGYSRYVHYEPIEMFLQRYTGDEGAAGDPRGDGPADQGGGLVKLKKTSKRFRPPESDAANDDDVASE